ncbi:peptide deformylase [Mycoplasmopsis hyopharyngis]|uniref:peptide deformylase n=1 Tax=Mycoplasmopsis hyopharyngis TaxID=29558 RepID=UPI003873589B
MKEENNKKYNVRIVQLPNKVLRQKSKNVPIPLTAEDIELAEKMIYHIDDSQKPDTKFQPGVGVAAVQYGTLKRVFYINNENFKDVLFNPKVIAASEQMAALSSGEGCLSVPLHTKDTEGYVKRSNRIVVEAYSYKERKWKTYDVIGYNAIIMQHELDHLEGKLFLDHIENDDPWKPLDNKNRKVIIL